MQPNKQEIVKKKKKKKSLVFQFMKENIKIVNAL